ncbi:hypothetical protein [Thermoactinospora rubra]|uniref:hypothetical protein n=1 Tax=Thermoactinospora rubra TaxID=1088767 RepID=UPI000A0FEA42|nr:hypothetical protein [Thermoactinospora rubra]
MEQLIATVTPYVVVLGGGAWVLYKLVAYPLRKCPRCRGGGNLPAGLLGRYRRCGRCGGTGEVRGMFGRRT